MLLRSIVEITYLLGFIERTTDHANDRDEEDNTFSNLHLNFSVVWGMGF